MQVPLLDLKGQYAPLRAEIEQVMAQVCNEQRFVLGPNVTELEAGIAAYSHARHGLGVSSGTDALLVALMALGIGPGDEVIVPTHTFIASVLAVWQAGAKPVLVDVDPKYYTMDPEATARAITPR